MLIPNVTSSNVNFQTKYTLIDEQDIPLVEGYSFEVRILFLCWPAYGRAKGGHEGWVFTPVM